MRACARNGAIHCTGTNHTGAWNSNINLPWCVGEVEWVAHLTSPLCVSGWALLGLVLEAVVGAGV